MFYSGLLCTLESLPLSHIYVTVGWVVPCNPLVSLLLLFSLLLTMLLLTQQVIYEECTVDQWSGAQAVCWGGPFFITVDADAFLVPRFTLHCVQWPSADRPRAIIIIIIRLLYPARRYSVCAVGDAHIEHSIKCCIGCTYQHSSVYCLVFSRLRMCRTGQYQFRSTDNGQCTQSSVDVSWMNAHQKDERRRF